MGWGTGGSGGLTPTGPCTATCRLKPSTTLPSFLSSSWLPAVMGEGSGTFRSTLRVGEQPRATHDTPQWAKVWKKAADGSLSDHKRVAQP